MQQGKRGQIQKHRWQVLTGLALALAVMLALVVPTAGGPPTLRPPEIFKSASEKIMAVGEQVRFTIIVLNPDESNQAEWRDVTVTDEVDPAFRIDSVSVDPQENDVRTDGNRVVVEYGSLEPGEGFEVVIRCTLVGPAQPGDVLVNRAKVTYKDEAGDPKDPIWSDPVEVKVVEGQPQPPTIVKKVSAECLDVGQAVRFTVTVTNPPASENAVTWYKVRVTDEIDPALRIDEVLVSQSSGELGAAGAMDSEAGNRVVAEIKELKPGESLVITIDCTLMEVPSPWRLITNSAVLVYEDAGGEAQPPIQSNQVSIRARACVFLPFETREFTP